MTAYLDCTGKSKEPCFSGGAAYLSSLIWEEPSLIGQISLTGLRSPLIGLRRKCEATGLVGAAEI